MAYGLETFSESQRDQMFQQHRQTQLAIINAYRSTIFHIDSSPQFTSYQKQVLSSELQKQAMHQLQNLDSNLHQSDLQQAKWKMEYGVMNLNVRSYPGYIAHQTTTNPLWKEKPKSPRVPSSFERGVKWGIPVLAIIILAMRLFG